MPAAVPQRSASADPDRPPHRHAAQRAACDRMPYPDRATRDDRLAAANSQEFGHRSAHETHRLEIFPRLEAVKHARRHPGRWLTRCAPSPAAALTRWPQRPAA